MLKNFKKMEEMILHVILQAEKEKFTQEKYNQFIEKIANGIKTRNFDNKIIKELKTLLSLYQNTNDEKSLKFMENILIKLIGHPDRDFRNEAIKLLNMLYDETDWQSDQGFKPKIISIGDEIKLEFLINKKDYEENSLILILNTPTFKQKEKENTIKWLKPEIIKNEEILEFSKINPDENNLSQSLMKININKEKYELLKTFNLLNKEINEIANNQNLILVTFSANSKIIKSGYYDFNLVKFSNGKFTTVKKIDSAKLENETTPAKGRFIAIDKSLKDYTVHEIFADLTNADIDKEKGRITRRGTFADVEKKLEDFSEKAINCLYIMGALERDNQICIDEDTKEIIDINNTEASPMAVTCRASISNMLGGDNAFNSLIKKAKKLSMKIIIDSLTRISSSRPHRKYRNIFLNTLDLNGKLTICYGTDGQSVNYEDSALLNYRKIESWDLLVEDTLKLAEKYNIDGLHLDNCQSWPQIFEIDFAEMLRFDSDGEFAYTSEEIVNGDIVYNNKTSEDNGFWASDVIDEYPNPFLIKLTKSVWKIIPNFLFIGESWGNKQSQNRHIILSKSGIIPIMYTLPRALSSVFGRKIH